MKGFAPKMPSLPKKLPPLKDEADKKQLRSTVMAKLKGKAC